MESENILKNVCYILLYNKSLIKVKGKIHPRTGHEGPEGDLRYSSTLSLTLALYGVGWSTPRPGRFTPGKTRYPLYRRLGGPEVRSGRVRKILPLPCIEPPTLQLVASRYNKMLIQVLSVLPLCRKVWCVQFGSYEYVHKIRPLYCWFTPSLHTTRPPTHSDSYHRLYLHNLSLLMMSTMYSKHVESYK